MEKYGRAGQATDLDTMQPIRCACWIPKATDTQLEYLILAALAWQKSLHERA